MHQFFKKLWLLFNFELKNLKNWFRIKFIVWLCRVSLKITFFFGQISLKDFLFWTEKMFYKSLTFIQIPFANEKINNNSMIFHNLKNFI